LRKEHLLEPLLLIWHKALSQRRVAAVNRRTAIVLSALLFLAGCQYDPWANGFVATQPAEQEVAGTYAIDADSQKRSIKIPMSNAAFPVNRTARIVLSPDHKAEFLHVPQDYQGEKACSVTGRGSWNLGKIDRYAVVRASIVNQESGSPCDGEFAYELHLYGKRPPYKLHVTIGDPDAGDAVQFEKQQ
jgi:hypothetical protein